MVLAKVRQAVLPPKIVAVRSTAASPLNPSALNFASDTAVLSAVGAPRVRLGAVPDQVRRLSVVLDPDWSHRMMKSPALRLAHGLQFAMSCASVAVPYAQAVGAGFLMNS